ncbi:hypothetical protein GCM10010358_07390 [Streptomyces minutiscleroticus]|uniref:NlpC/P60 domain-containing protein n=1 Tax=Streptomyces minutiscleroticus TaxID=68238 RepID=A0A918K9S7_9ACTN|nr:C40 family peptidase [Streptomyces minutiscleroticus]GGX56004.1 hypothetical protein GCM10010358_07390 [Streptomyces minutiscleroticus]
MSGRLPRWVCAAATAATLLAPAPATAAPEPGGRSVAELLTDLQRLYRETEEATEAYNATEEELREQRVAAARLRGRLAQARAALEDGRAEVGRLARRQYQGDSGGISPYVRLLLARDPQHALDQGHVVRRLARDRAAAVKRLAAGERRAEDLDRAVHAALERRAELTERRRKERDTVRARLREVEETLASLDSGRLAELAELEEAGAAKAQERFLASGALGEAARTPTRAGAEALEYAVGQIGKPYEWGAEGPGAYDCSGLTSRAWERAGVPIPRTSQEQWDTLERVHLDELRPGDLVVYFPGATHVALYLGDGRVVQAPRPGARVKVSPIAANPVLGAVRPDPGGEPLRRYTPPELPEGATEGSDRGYAPAAPETSIR